MLGEHAQMMRNSISFGEDGPSAETLNAWRLEDIHRAMAIRYYEQKEAAEAEEPVNVNIKSEVRVKR